MACTNISETVGSAWATPTHDAAGNMTAIPKPSDLTASYDATWDAWHRLVSLKEGATTVAGYQYDGNGRRMVKEIYSAGSLDETRHVYYSTQSQAIEERVDSSTDAEIQFVWNLGYVDDLLLRDRDTSANGVLDERLYSLPDLRYCVMALADSSGAVVERFTYDALGKALVMSPLFGARTGSNYDWEFRYTGRREDLETGLMYFRARYFSNDLGRFVSRDPLEFVDGVNLYRGYMVPNGVDPTGFFSSKADIDGWLFFQYHHNINIVSPSCLGGRMDVAANGSLNIWVAKGNFSLNFSIAATPNALPQAACGFSFGAGIFNPYWDWKSTRTYLGITLGAKVGFINLNIDYSYGIGLTSTFDPWNPLTWADWGVKKKHSFKPSATINIWSSACCLCYTVSATATKSSFSWNVKPGRIVTAGLIATRLPAFARGVAKAFKRAVDDIAPRIPELIPS